MWEILNLSPVTVEETNMNKRVFLMLAAVLMTLTASVVYADKISNLQKKAESCDAEAQYELGFAYAEGAGKRDLAEMGDDLTLALDGVEQDYVKAAEWYQKSAEQGFEKAQCNLAWCYMTGRGVKQDFLKGVEWYQKAVKQGYAPAQNDLAVCYHNGIGVTQDSNKAAELWQRAAEQGWPQAQFNLGQCYAKGWGVEKNLIKAMEWYQKAAEQEFTPAVILLQKFSEL